MADQTPPQPHPDQPVDLDQLNQVKLWLCAMCLDGDGGECHTPGCAFWMSTAPDLSLRDAAEPVGGQPQPDTTDGPCDRRDCKLGECGSSLPGEACGGCCRCLRGCLWHGPDEEPHTPEGGWLDWTRHGHWIGDGLLHPDTTRPAYVATCGGPSACEVCASDAQERAEIAAMSQRDAKPRPDTPTDPAACPVCGNVDCLHARDSRVNCPTKWGTPTDPEPPHVTEMRERVCDLLDELAEFASNGVLADEIVNRLLWRWLVPDQPNATVLTEDVVQAVHTALCGECGDTGTGLTVRSADLDKVRAAVAPLLAGVRGEPHTTPGDGDLIERAQRRVGVITGSLRAARSELESLASNLDRLKTDLDRPEGGGRR